MFTRPERHWKARALSVVGAASALVWLLAPTVALAANASTQGACAGSPNLTLAQTAQRFADNIKSDAGDPTATGKAFLAAAATGSYGQVATLVGYASNASGSATSAGSAVTTNTVVGFMLTGRQGATAAVQTQSAIAQRTLASSHHATGANIWLPSCGFNVRATAIWYCGPGSQCSSEGHFSDGSSQVVNNGGCSIVNTYSCQVGTVATPHATSVTEIDIFQTRVGSPTFGDRWCG
jgi:hypothetical protein